MGDTPTVKGSGEAKYQLETTKPKPVLFKKAGTEPAKAATPKEAEAKAVKANEQGNKAAVDLQKVTKLPPTPAPVKPTTLTDNKWPAAPGIKLNLLSTAKFSPNDKQYLMTLLSKAGFKGTVTVTVKCAQLQANAPWKALLTIDGQTSPGHTRHLEPAGDWAATEAQALRNTLDTFKEMLSMEAL